MILLISAFWVAGITDMHPHAWHWQFNFKSSTTVISYMIYKYFLSFCKFSFSFSLSLFPLFSFCCGVGDWIQGLAHTRQMLYHRVLSQVYTHIYILASGERIDTCYVVQAGLELEILLPECWDYRCLPPYLALSFLMSFAFLNNNTQNFQFCWGLFLVSDSFYIILRIYCPQIYSTIFFPKNDIALALTLGLWYTLNSFLYMVCRRSRTSFFCTRYLIEHPEPFIEPATSLFTGLVNLWTSISHKNVWVYYGLSVLSHRFIYLPYVSSTSFWLL
jgi:hypothetical protein